MINLLKDPDNYEQKKVAVLKYVSRQVQARLRDKVQKKLELGQMLGVFNVF